ncbi:class I SAM-dependent methyltransferase [Thermoanaerobacterium sp. R66]|uniref:class I SAM-dependent methyltransferase n=1 Tax=Thermoanaerobacterium sp. R66 TaxID=2742479 RepID=UPI0023809DA7|nr:class I SAM-dependent methyltransferase [Thermoanaerobacterium sp. R66]MDE4543212.1 methyltransferase domain-containing protein [Thermoanaerobacterium sp. R66]
MTNGVECYFNNTENENFIDEFDVKMVYYYITSKINFKLNSNVLSLGCGNLEFEKELSKNRPDLKIYGVDFIDKLKYFKGCFKNIYVVKKNILEIDNNSFENKFDVVYSFSVLQYLSDLDILNLNRQLLKLINDDGLIYHFDIPDKRKKYISRYNNIINSGKTVFSIFNGREDFNDLFSRWIDIRIFKKIKNASISIIYPSFKYDRFEVKIEKNT